MRRADIQTAAELYYAPGPDWQSRIPTRAVVVDAAPHRIVRRRQGPFWLVSYVPDEVGDAVVVDLYDVGSAPSRTAVRVRDLRGLWVETLATLGRTEAAVAGRVNAIRNLASTRGPITADGLLGLAAAGPELDDDTFAVLARVVDGRPFTEV
jgi:hypothetical protein